MDLMFLIQIILGIIMTICCVGWIIASWVERDLFFGEWCGKFLEGWLVSGFAGIVITLMRLM